MHLCSELRDFWDLFVNDVLLSLALFEFEVDHTDLLLLRADGLFALFETVFLDIALLIVDAELIVTVDQLDTHIVTALTGHLILVDKVIHLLLEGVNDKVEFIALIDFLTDDGFLLLVDEVLLVEVRTEGISLVDLFLDLVLDVNERTIFLT